MEARRRWQELESKLDLPDAQEREDSRSLAERGLDATARGVIHLAHSVEQFVRESLSGSPELTTGVDGVTSPGP